MASRVGIAGRTERPSSRGVNVRVDTIAAPRIGQGAAQAWSIMARSASRVQNRAAAIYENEASVEGSLRGTRDALAGAIDPNTNRSTVRGAAYTKAAVDTALTTMSANAQLHLLELFMQNPDDPAALLDAAKSYGDGLTGALMEIDPGAAVAGGARLATSARPLITSAINNREQKVAAAKKAARERAEAINDASTAVNAEHLFSDDPEEAAASMAAVQQSYADTQRYVSASEAEQRLLPRLSNGKSKAHVISMDDRMKTRLAMLLDAAPANIRDKLGIYSGYRSVEHQRTLWANALKKYGSAKAARKWVAPPGKSNHNGGFAADLSYDGKSLASAPASVKKWVHDNAERFGLKFPLAHEPWHIEIAETRGGAPFDGVKPNDTQILYDQKFYDQNISAGAKAWILRQDDWVTPYMDLVQGELVLPTYDKDGNQIDVNISERLSDDAYEELLADVARQIKFRNTQEDRAAKAGDDATAERQAQNKAALTFRTLASGETVTLSDGTEKTLERPTYEELLEAQSRRDISATDFTDLVESIQKQEAEVDDEQFAELMITKVNSGEDIKDDLMNNLDRLTSKRVKELFDYNRVAVERRDELSDNQKFFMGRLEKALQSSGPGGALDQSVSQRIQAAVIEYNARVREGDPAEDVYNDIVGRASYDLNSIGRLVNSRDLTPRFAVPDPTRPGWINPAASAQALATALAEGRITAAGFERQKRLIVRWQRSQQAALAAEQARTKK